MRREPVRYYVVPDKNKNTPPHKQATNNPAPSGVFFSAEREITATTDLPTSNRLVARDLLDSDVERLRGPVVHLHRETVCTQVANVGRNGLESLELARMTSLRLEQLFVQTFAHDEHEAPRHPLGHERARLAGAHKLP